MVARGLLSYGSHLIISGVVLVPRREVDPHENDSALPTPNTESATPENFEHDDAPPPYRETEEAARTLNGSQQTPQSSTPAKKGLLHRVAQHPVVQKIVKYGKQVHAAAVRVVNHVKKITKPTGARGTK